MLVLNSAQSEGVRTGESDVVTRFNTIADDEFLISPTTSFAYCVEIPNGVLYGQNMLFHKH